MNPAHHGHAVMHLATRTLRYYPDLNPQLAFSEPDFGDPYWHCSQKKDVP
jgi:hypothetical protein